MKTMFSTVGVFVAALGFLEPSFAHAQKIDSVAKLFTKTESMIAMRDGVKLYTTIYVPKAVKGALPFIFLRTPYGIESRGPQSLIPRVRRHKVLLHLNGTFGAADETRLLLAHEPDSLASDDPGRLVLTLSKIAGQKK